MRPIHLFALLFAMSAVLVAGAGETEAISETGSISTRSPGALATSAPSERSRPRFQAALQQALRLEDVDTRLWRLSDLGAGLTVSEIPKALTAATGLDELRERMALTQAALVRWGELAPEDAFAYVADLPETQLKGIVLRHVAIKLALEDPRRTAAAAADMNPGASRSDVIPTIARIWAERDAPAAMEWADMLPNSLTREAALEGIRYVWSQSDPAAASADVVQLPSGELRTNLMGSVAFAWASRDTEAAINWARSLPDGSDKNEAMGRIAEAWANRDPEAAAAFALKLEPGAARTAAAAMVAWSWARQDPRAALEWAWQTEDPEIRRRSAPAVFEVWAPVDPAESGRWVANLPPGPQRDPFILAYVDSVVAWAPDLAARSTRLIADDDSRAGALDQSLRHWREVDPAAAEQWLRGADLPVTQGHRPGDR